MAKKVLLCGGMIFDGTGSIPFRGDILIEGDRIEGVGAVPAGDDAAVVDCGSLYVAPGFIDIHSHSDCSLLAEPPPYSKISQGVTTEVVGNCGLSGGPLLGECGRRFRSGWAVHGVDVEWESFGEYLQRLESARKPVNVASLVGHNNLRASVRGYRGGSLTESDLRRAISLLEAALASGAFGVSTGLMYPPGIHSSMEEIVAFAKTVAGAGGVYATHMRDEGDSLIEAVEEAVNVSRLSGAPLHISHIKAYGRENWKKLPELFFILDEARRGGLDITCDRYPYIAAHTGLDALLPGWVHEGGIDEELVRLSDPGSRRALIEFLEGEMEDDLRGVVISFPGPYDGRSVAEIAGELSLPPAETVLKIVLDSKARAEAFFFRMCEENLDKILGKSYVMVASDSSARPFPSAGRAHPRSYGTFPRLLSRYAGRGKLKMEEAINKMTGMPSARLGLAGRGTIMRGNFADITVFSPGELKDTATYDAPARVAEGIRYVFVNGELVWKNGRSTGKYPGRVLRR